MKELSEIIHEQDSIDQRSSKLQRFSISKKYTFALFSSFCVILVLIIVHNLQFSDQLSEISIVCSQFSLLVIAITYLSGQAKIDIQASATYGKTVNTPQTTPHVSTPTLGLEASPGTEALPRQAPLSPELKALALAVIAQAKARAEK